MLAKADGKGFAKTEIADVGDWLTRVASARADIDLRGFRLTLDNHAVRHILKNHGDATKERARGQLAVTPEDFRALPALLSSPERVVFGLEAKGLPMIAFLARDADGATLLVEQVRTGRRTLALLSMRKYPATTKSESIVSTLRPNARGDGEDGLDIVDVPAGSKITEPRSLDQSYFDGPRGRITFETGGRSVIELFAARDLSTFVHEIGHLYLEELRADATPSDAPEELRADWAIVTDWFAANGHPIGADGVRQAEDRLTAERKAPPGVSSSKESDNGQPARHQPRQRPPGSPCRSAERNRARSGRHRYSRQFAERAAGEPGQEHSDRVKVESSP